MKYRKRPVIIEAEQFCVFSDRNEKQFKITVNGMLFPLYKDEKGYYILIPTMEGTMRADNLDWIIKGIAGEYYPCKPNIFEKTYEPVND